MKYERKGDSHVITNGQSRLRCKLMGQTRGATKELLGHTIKLFHIQEVLRSNPANPIQVGNAIALAFPDADAGRAKFEWKAGMITQVPIVFDMEPPKAPVVTQTDPVY
jgi:hypothetical protein